MSAAMKKPLTEIQIRLGNKMLRFTHVPSKQVKPILILLKGYEEPSEPWREGAKKRMNAAGGEAAYMLKSARKMADLTQTQLADKLKMPQGNLSQIESGQRTIGKSLAKRLAKIFNLDYRVFL